MALIFRFKYQGRQPSIIQLESYLLHNCTQKALAIHSQEHPRNWRAVGTTYAG